MLDSEKKSFLYASSAVLLWSTVATAFKLTLEGMSYAQLLFYASLTSTFFLFISGISKEKKILTKIFNRRNFRKNILLGLINPFLYYLVLFKAYSLLPAQEAQPLNYTWPIMISGFSAVFLKQKLSLRTVLGLIVAFLGVVIISTRGNVIDMRFHDIWGVILAVGSSVIWASFWTLNLLDRRSINEKLLGAFVTGTIFTAVYLAVFDSFVVENIVYLSGAIYAGLFEMGVTFFLWMKGLQLSANKAKTSTIAYFSPFISVLFIALVLKEEILTSSIVGLVLIVGGVLFQHIGKGSNRL